MNLGMTGIELPNLGLGCMSMSEGYGDPMPETDAIELIRTAYKNGISFFDTADMYAYGKNEILVGKAISHLIDEGVNRSQITLATKCGIVRDEHDPKKRDIDNSYDYVLQACEASLGRLGQPVEYIDLFYLHRIAKDGAQIDEAMQAMAKLLESGKIKAVGLSEASTAVIQQANEALLKYTQGKHQLAAVQSEYSLMTREPELNGVLAVCRELGITFIAYSPLSRALLTGKIETPDQLAENDVRRDLPRFSKENMERNHKIIEAVKNLAESKSCSTAQIALAWVMHQPGVVPIPGTTKQKNLLSNIDASKIVLTESELDQLNILPQAEGYRYTEASMKAFGFDDEMQDK